MQGMHQSLSEVPELLLKVGDGHSGKLHPGSHYPSGGRTNTNVQS